MATVYLGLGTNIGDRAANLRQAISEINNRIGSVQDQSDFIITEPWGFSSCNLFFNAVVKVATSLTPQRLLQAAKTIEEEMGRTDASANRRRETSAYKDRIIDIDILLYDDLRIETDSLTIPHPLMYDRDFVMIPLRQVMERDHSHCPPRDDSAESF